MAFAYFVNGWDLCGPPQIAGVALSTTSVAVVYAVMIETGLNETDLGKLILAACFVTDLERCWPWGRFLPLITAGCSFLWW